MKYFFSIFCALMLALTTQAQTLHIIESGNFFYTPKTLTIEVGDTVRWVNVGGFHNVNAEENTITGEDYNNPESFRSAPTSEPVLLTRVFTVPGTYEYDCSVGSHAANGMIGTLIVDENATSTHQLQEEVSAWNAFYNSEYKAIQLSFNLKYSPNNTSIYISNLVGQQLKYEKINAQSGLNQYQLNLDSDMPSGIYLISIRLDGVIETKKIFVQ